MWIRGATVASMLALSSGLAFTQGNVAGDFCKVRALKDMESSYPSGFISLGPSQIFAFSNNWRTYSSASTVSCTVCVGKPYIR